MSVTMCRHARGAADGIESPDKPILVAATMAARGRPRSAQDQRVQESRAELDEAISDAVGACLENLMKPPRPDPSGLRWWNRGMDQPEGEALENAELSKALESKTEFTFEEWKDFGVPDLRIDHFVSTSSGYYFQPENPLDPTDRRPYTEALYRTEDPLGYFIHCIKQCRKASRQAGLYPYPTAAERQMDNQFRENVRTDKKRTTGESVADQKEKLAMQVCIP